MPANDLSLLIEAARIAADVALPFVGGAMDIRTKPDDSPVTQADLAVNAALETHLRGARPDYGWLSEESADDTDRLSAGRGFIIDPIDGTRSFIEGDTSWAHALAVVEAEEVVAAVVYLPRLDRMYTAARGAGARMNGEAIRVSATDTLSETQVLATKPTLQAQFWPGGVPPLKRSYRPSLAYRLCLVAQGRFDAMFTFRPTWEWDIAAGTLILQEAGARITDRRGAALRFNAAHPQADGVLAANPGLHTALLDRMF